MISYYYIRYVPATVGICVASYFYYKSFNKKLDGATQVTNTTQATQTRKKIQVSQATQVTQEEINKTFQDKELDLSSVIVDPPDAILIKSRKGWWF